MADMLVKLYELPENEPALRKLEKNGVLIRRAMPYENQLVTEWVNDLFSGGWASECAISLNRLPASCFIATEESRIIGFACYDATSRGFFGPTGVAPEKRGRGIGRALLLACLHAMRQEGYAYAIIGGVGPTEFYAQTVGARLIEGSSPGIYRDRLRK